MYGRSGEGGNGTRWGGGCDRVGRMRSGVSCELRIEIRLLGDGLGFLRNGMMNWV